MISWIMISYKADRMQIDLEFEMDNLKQLTTINNLDCVRVRVRENDTERMGRE